MLRLKSSKQLHWFRGLAKGLQFLNEFKTLTDTLSSGKSLQNNEVKQNKVKKGTYRKQIHHSKYKDTWSSGLGVCFEGG